VAERSTTIIKTRQNETIFNAADAQLGVVSPHLRKMGGRMGWRWVIWVAWWWLPIGSPHSNHRPFTVFAVLRLVTERRTDGIGLKCIDRQLQLWPGHSDLEGNWKRSSICSVIVRRLWAFTFQWRRGHRSHATN